MSDKEAVLELIDVDTYYGQIHALKGINISVTAGSIVSLIGSNGAGKSTTLKTISGLIKPTKGKIFFKGQDMHSHKSHEITCLGIAHVPEGRKIFSRMSIKENLEMGAFLVKNSKKILSNMEKVFHLFPRLKERISQKGGTLSGGEQQMLAIGRALMSDPKILLMDEPSMGLAPILVKQIFDSITQLNKDGMTILLVEQNANKALKISTKGYVLQTGNIVLEGSGQFLLNSPMVKEAYLG